MAVWFLPGVCALEGLAPFIFILSLYVCVCGDNVSHFCNCRAQRCVCAMTLLIPPLETVCYCCCWFVMFLEPLDSWIRLRDPTCVVVWTWSNTTCSGKPTTTPEALSWRKHWNLIPTPNGAWIVPYASPMPCFFPTFRNGSKALSSWQPPAVEITPLWWDGVHYSGSPSLDSARFAFTEVGWSTVSRFIRCWWEE